MAQSGQTEDTKVFFHFRAVAGELSETLQQSTFSLQSLHALLHLYLHFQSSTPAKAKKNKWNNCTVTGKAALKESELIGWKSQESSLSTDVGTKDFSFENCCCDYYKLHSVFCACILHRQISHLRAFGLRRELNRALFIKLRNIGPQDEGRKCHPWNEVGERSLPLFPSEHTETLL